MSNPTTDSNPNHILISTANQTANLTADLTADLIADSTANSNGNLNPDPGFNQTPNLPLNLPLNLSLNLPLNLTTNPTHILPEIMFIQACTDGDLLMVRHLIRNGCNTSYLNNMGLNMAIRKGRVEVITEILSSHFDLNQILPLRNYDLYFTAVKYTQLESLKLLFQKLEPGQNIIKALLTSTCRYEANIDLFTFLFRFRSYDETHNRKLLLLSTKHMNLEVVTYVNILMKGVIGTKVQTLIQTPKQSPKRSSKKALKPSMKPSMKPVIKPTI